MLKNLSVYVMFRANGEEQEIIARRNVRLFVVLYIAVLVVFEGLNTYYNLFVYCFTCTADPSKGRRFIYFTLNLIKFFLNLVLVIISFLHANSLKEALKETDRL